MTHHKWYCNEGHDLVTMSIGKTYLTPDKMVINIEMECQKCEVKGLREVVVDRHPTVDYIEDNGKKFKFYEKEVE